MQRFLIIQTAFIGDVVLALPVAQVLRAHYPEAEIHLVVRKGNEGLVTNHPAVNHCWTWEKKRNKFRNLRQLASTLGKVEFDAAFNLHRFASSGFLMSRIRAKTKVGFDKNPLAVFLDHKVPHLLPAKTESGSILHEVDRNISLLYPIIKNDPRVIRQNRRPRMYPSVADRQKVAELPLDQPYVVMAPTSVWFTKQWAAEQWQKLIALVPETHRVFLIGGPGDHAACEQLVTDPNQVQNLCGSLNFLQSAALMEGAQRVFVNDSAPQHFASAVNAPTTAIFCSTVPEFGFGPLADDARVIQVETPLACRPCGLHGHRACPKGHFDCALKIDPKKVWETV